MEKLIFCLVQVFSAWLFEVGFQVLFLTGFMSFVEKGVYITTHPLTLNGTNSILLSNCGNMGLFPTTLYTNDFKERASLLMSCGTVLRISLGIKYMSGLFNSTTSVIILSLVTYPLWIIDTKSRPPLPTCLQTSILQ